MKGKRRVNRKKFAVIGLGDFGSNLVRFLAEEGQEVVAIDIDIEKVDDLKDIATEALCLDSTDDRALKSLSLHEFDAVVLAAADNFETLMITADLIKKMGVDKIYARYRTELHKRLLALLGIHRCFNPEERAAKNMAEQLSYGESILTSLQLRGDLRLIEATAPSSIVGLSLRDTGMREKYALNLVAIQRSRQRGETEIPTSRTIIHDKDILIIFGHQSDIESFLKKTV